MLVYAEKRKLVSQLHSTTYQEKASGHFRKGFENILKPWFTFSSILLPVTSRKLSKCYFTVFIHFIDLQQPLRWTKLFLKASVDDSIKHI